MTAFVAGDHAAPLVRFIGDKLRYVQAEKRWYVCDDKQRPGYWAPENRLQTITYAKAYLQTVAEPVTKFNVDSVLYLARDIVAATTDDFDADPWRLGVQNGVLDLRTNEMLEIEPDMLLTRQAGTAYDENATCPRWERHVLRLANGNTDVAFWLQIAGGVTLIGHEPSKPHIFPYLRGDGGNGKGSFIRGMHGVFGEYGHVLPVSELVKGEQDRHMTTLASLKGVRFVSVEETPARSLNTTRLKNLTGGDRISARLIGGNLFTFPPSHLFWLTSNRLPRFGANETDNALKRRYRPVLTGPALTDSERIPTWEEQLAEERPGILNWLLHGLAVWLDLADRELPSPEVMLKERDAVIAEQDLYGEWGETRLDFSNREAWTTTDDLIASVNNFRMGRSLYPLTEAELQDLYDYLSGVDGLQREQRRLGGQGRRRGWIGVQIRTPDAVIGR